MDVVIVGAGLSGLSAGRALMQAGHDVLILDKGRSVGGRMATRRIGPGRADHGAQFFTVRDDAFDALVQTWLAEDRVYVWGYGWSSGSHDDAPADGHPRYVARGGMNALTKHMAEGLPVQTSTRVTSISQGGEGWQVHSSDETQPADALILTAPVPQSLAMLAKVDLHPDDQATLEAITYGPCLCGLFWVEGPLELPDPGAIQRQGADFRWIADNQAKGISPEAQLITVHASPEWSRTYFDSDDKEAILDALFAPLLPFGGAGVALIERQLKKWRYAIPEQTHPERTLVAQGLPPLIFAGDAFGGPRVEGAVLSGLAAATVLG